MNLIDLVLVVCSLANPADCSERHLALVAEGSPMQCAMQAPPILAQWVGEHPRMRVARWSCVWPQRESRRS